MQDPNSSNVDSIAREFPEEVSADIATSAASRQDTASRQDSALALRPKHKPMSLGLGIFLSMGLVTVSILGFSVFIQLVQAIQQQVLNPEPAPIQPSLTQPTVEPLDDAAVPTPIEPSETKPSEAEPAELTPIDEAAPVEQEESSTPASDADSSDAAEPN